MNWADSKHTVNSGKPHAGNPDPSRCNTHEGRETRHGESICCAKCGTTKERTEFYLKDSKTGRKDTTCKPCRIIEHRQINLGVSEADYRRMYVEQEGVCGICRKRLYSKRYKSFVVDHCHTTGRIRGLLCSKCNLALGGFSDCVENLARALKWIKV